MMATQSNPLIFLITLCCLISTLYGQACSTLDSSACASDTYCSWTGSLCECANTMDQDIIFLVDASNNVDETEFTYIKDFINNLLTYASPTNTRVGLATFANPSTATEYYISLSENIDAASAQSTVSGMVTIDSDSMNAQTAVEWAISEFDSETTTARKVLVTIIAGVSSGPLCSSLIHTSGENIDSYVIAVGYGWQKRVYECFVEKNNNFEGLIAIDDVSDILDSTQQETTEEFLCPHKPLIEITEANPSKNNVAYFEFYNKGHDLTASSLSFSGLFTGSLAASTTITQGSFVVIYDSTSSATAYLPDCESCDCSAGIVSGANSAGFRWCSDAFYFGCGDNSGNSFETVTGNCDVYSSGQTVSDWDISISYSGVSGTVESVDYDTADASGLYAGVTTDYAYEVIAVGYYNGFGTSWAQSCNEEGTPGEGPLDSCSGGCTGASMCQVGGDSSASCGSNVCSCSEAYYNYEDIVCLPLPAPENCTGYFDGSGISPVTDYYLDLGNWDGIWRFFVRYCESQTGETDPATSGDCQFQSSRTFGLPQEVTTSDSSPEGWETFPATIALTDATSNTQKSATTQCTTITAEPTRSPTPQPTYAADALTSCEYLLDSNLEGFTLIWDNFTNGGSSHPPYSDILGYKWYDNGSPRTLDLDDCCSYHVDYRPDTFEIGSDVITMSIDYDESVTGISDSEEASVAITCVEYTQNPTFKPTSLPTDLPTIRPSDMPSEMPTPSPTFEPLEVQSCLVEYVVGLTDRIELSYVAPVYDWPNTVNESQVTYNLYYDSQKQEEILNNPSTLTLKATVPWSGANSDFEMYITWESSQNANNVDRTTCTKTSESPTLSPSGLPSGTPTHIPSTEPTARPSNFPTEIPTPAPTYISPNMTWCHASFGKKNKDVGLTWELIELDPPDNTPPAEDVEYVVELDGTKFFTQDQFEENETIAEKIIFISEFVIGNDSVTMYVQYDNGERSNTVTCTISTSTPTLAPSSYPTSLPTVSPTFGAVNVYLTKLTYCEEDRCGCNNTECNSYDTPIEIVRESSVDYEFYVRRSETCYPYNISINYTIDIVSETMATNYGFNSFWTNYVLTANNEQLLNGTNITTLANSYFIPNATYFSSNDLTSDLVVGPTYKDIETDDWQGTFTVTSSAECCSPSGGNSEQCPRNNLADFGIEFIEESKTGIESGSIAPDKDGEIFMITLTSCNVQVAWDFINYTIDDNLTCFLSYPNQLFVIVEDVNTDRVDETVNTKNDSYNDWLWWVLLGIAIFLGILSYIVYRWWVNKRIKEQDVMDIEADVDAVIEEQEQGFGNDLDKDNVNFNPLAKPLAHIKGPTGAAGTGNSGASGEIADRAQVRVEKFAVRQQFGPTQAANRAGANATGDYV